MEIKKTITQIIQNPHCRNCGAIDPPITGYSTEDDQGGFSECCNERLCHHEDLYYFGNKKFSVQACCWAVAELEFRSRGIDIHQLEEIKRWS